MGAIVEDRLQGLIEKALQSGASDARIISSTDIVVRDEFAALCEGPHRCPNFSLALSCPPHVSGPEGFRRLCAKSRFSIVVKIEVPSEALFSEARREVYQLLHEIVAAVEREAIRIGYKASKSFAGGSCKEIFCHAYQSCRAISEQSGCRYPESARPSMSGFGVDVTSMMQSAGWRLKDAASDGALDKSAMSWIAGLVLLI